MRTRRLTAEHDWTFGRSRADYALRSEAVAQNLKTRLLSFANDWFLDLDANIDWIALLSARNTAQLIKQNVERVTLTTDGIATINRLEIAENRQAREALIELDVTDIFNEQFLLEVPVAINPTPLPIADTFALVGGDDFAMVGGEDFELLE